MKSMGFDTWMKRTQESKTVRIHVHCSGMAHDVDHSISSSIPSSAAVDGLGKRAGTSSRALERDVLQFVRGLIAPFALCLPIRRSNTMCATKRVAGWQVARLRTGIW